MAGINYVTTTLNTNSGTKTLSTGTLVLNDLLVVVTIQSGSNVEQAPTDNNSDGKGTYSLAASITWSTDKVVQVWVRNALIGNTTSCTVSHTPGVTTGGGVSLLRISGMSRSGISAVRQRGSAIGNSATTPTVGLGSAILTENPVVGSVGYNIGGSGVTAPSGWSENVDSGYATPTTGLEIASRASGETNSSIAWGATVGAGYGVLAVELDTSAPTGFLQMF